MKMELLCLGWEWSLECPLPSLGLAVGSMRHSGVEQAALCP